MRHVGDLPTHDQAQRFADYLLLRDVKVSIDQENGQWSIWAVEEDETDHVKTELNRFREAPDADEYRGHGSRAEQRRKAEEKANREFRKNQVNVRTRWGRGMVGAKAGPVTMGLIAISILVALVTEIGVNQNSFYQNLLFSAWSKVDGRLVSSGWQEILNGQVWRLFTPMFIHYGILHIVFNLYMLHRFGAQVESHLSTWNYFLLVLAISACANIGQYYWGHFSQHELPFGGMSGVVFGLFGYIWMKSIYEPQEGYFMPQQTVVILGIWLVLGMVGIIGGIANGAHVIGFFAGCAFGYAPTYIRRFLS